MQVSMTSLAMVLLRGAAFMLPTSGMACSLVPPDALVLKRMMAQEIAFRLAIKPEQVSLNDITPPELHRPLPLGADCSGLAAFHHSSGFSLAVAQQQQQQHTFATMVRQPHSASGAAARYRGRLAGGFYSRRPWAGVARNYWRVAPSKQWLDVDYSGYFRWPQYPREPTFAEREPAARPPYRWPQYPDESQVVWPGPERVPTRWSTMAMPPAGPGGPGLCRYEGVAVVLGYDSASPVAVNFRQQCD